MLDIKRIRQNPEALVEAMRKRRNKGADVTALLELDAKRREVMQEVEQLKAKRNEGSAKVPAMKKAGEDTTALMAEMKELGARVKELDDQIAKMDEELQSMLMSVPNIPHESVPEGADDKANVEVRRWSEPTRFDFEPKAHWDIGEDLGILDFATAGKITGARFTVYRGLGSRLERAIINYYLDTHTANGYTEIFPPYMVNRASMTGTGQLPKFEEDAFKVANTDYFLIPTAEVPVTNMLRGEIVDGDKLPIKYCAYSACFRSEAGSAGRDTRGLIRQHQFNKVELVKFTKPEDSYDELESLTRDAEKVLQGLGLPYHVVVLSTGDLGFSSAKTYDIEVWMPSYGRYVEISSCSNFEDFQARRAQIRFRREKGAKPELVADTWGLVGNITGWGDLGDFSMSEEGAYLVRKGVALTTASEFKIRFNNAWDDSKNYGTASGGAVDINKAVAIISSGGSQNMKVQLDGTYDIYFDLANSQIYIMSEGNQNIILCERGIRTFETSMRNTLDISAVPMLKSKTHLPVVIDPSHAAGIAWMVEPLAMAAIAAGADGLMIEVHNDPPHAKSDGAQSLTPAQFDALMGKVKAASAFFGKAIN